MRASEESRCRQVPRAEAAACLTGMKVSVLPSAGLPERSAMMPPRMGFFPKAAGSRWSAFSQGLQRRFRSLGQIARAGDFEKIVPDPGAETLDAFRIAGGLQAPDPAANGVLPPGHQGEPVQYEEGQRNEMADHEQLPAERGRLDVGNFELNDVPEIDNWMGNS